MISPLGLHSTGYSLVHIVYIRKAIRWEFFRLDRTMIDLHLVTIKKPKTLGRN